MSLRQILDVSVWSDNCAACSINVDMAFNVKCSMCSMKGTDAVSGAFAGAGTVRNVHCVVCRLQCAPYQRWKSISCNRMSQIFKRKCIFLGQVETIGFWKCKMSNKILIWFIPKKIFLKSFCVTLLSKCIMFAKSTILVIDITSMYKHTHKVPYKHGFFFYNLKVHKMGKKMDYVFFR